MAVELATAYVNLTASMSGISNDISKELGGPAVQSQVGKAGDKAGKTFAGKFGSAGKLAAKAVGVGILGAAAAGGAWAAQTVRDLANVQRIGALTESTIKATGGAAGRSRADVDALAGSIEKMSGVEAETVTEGQNMLLTFKNIKGQRFDQATTAMTDMAVAMNKGSLEGLDMKAASIQLGKALNDPVKGITALSKVGVSFTEQQKEQIKTLTEAGDVAGAQGVILGEMEAQFGGAAKAAGSTFQGNVAKLQNTFGNFSEGLLSGALPALTALITFLTVKGVPALERLGVWVTTNVVPAVRDMAAVFRDQVLPVLQGGVLPVLGRLIGFMVDNWEVFGSLTAAVLLIVGAMKTYTAVTTLAATVQTRYAAAMASTAVMKARSLAQTAALVAMYTGQWLAAQVRSIAGWVRETATIVAHRVALTAHRVGIVAWTAATRVAAVAQRGLNLVMRANPIGLIITAVGLLVATLVWFFTKTELGQKIVRVAWAGIKSAISSVANWWTKTAWPAIRNAVEAMGRWFVSAKNTIVRAWNAIKEGAAAAWYWVRDRVIGAYRTAVLVMATVFNAVKARIVGSWNAIRSGAVAAWNWINRWVIAPFKLGVQILASVFIAQKDRIVGAFRSMRDGLRVVGAWIRSNIFDPLKRAVGLVGDAFRRTPAVVGEAWNRIKAAAARPINFVINTVYTKGIKGTWDKIADAVGLDLSLPTIKPIAFARGSEDHRAQIASAGAMRLWAEPETGGEAYIPLAQSKRGRSTAILGAVASKFGYGLQKYADGGISGWFGDAWDKIKDVSSSFLSGPAALIKRLITGPMNSALGSVGGGTLGKIAGTLPKKLVSGLIDKAKDFASSMFGGGSDLKGGGRFSGGPVMGWQNMWNVLKNAFPGASLNSAFRPGAITAVGTPSFHGQGRAIDVSPSMAIFNWLAKTFPNSAELIFSPAGNRQLYMGRKTTFGEPTRSDHYDHVHWAMANGGIFPSVYDSGGMMYPGQAGINLGSRPEAVLDPDETRALKAGLAGGPLIGTLVAADPNEAVRKFQSLQRRAMTRAGLSNRRG